MKRADKQDTYYRQHLDGSHTTHADHKITALLKTGSKRRDCTDCRLYTMFSTNCQTHRTLKMFKTSTHLIILLNNTTGNKKHPFGLIRVNKTTRVNKN